MASTQQEDGTAVRFGGRYAVLNLDWMSVLVSAVKDTPEGQAFIANCARWNDAVHALEPQPTTIFTTLCFSNSLQPELHPHDRKPFTRTVRGFGTFAKESPEVQLDSRFVIGDKDIVLPKTRWYAGAGNSLEQVLKSQNIDTVIISGATLSGVVLSTIYHLADLDYEIYVISDNVVEMPANHTEEYSRFILRNLLGKLNVHVVTLEEAINALQLS
ncbi:hypothetical protein VTK73DRAFT_5787 [Phialemonium thermophilum]|uniref:Isochorismatase-like domain-containing protein n=1 Tax=Phialemonium thermophilum TaxID=223376 RepID=A0ABR3WLS7_9PEZI